MKNLFRIFFLAYLTLGMTWSLKAQQAFDSKKHLHQPANTSSLNARKIDGSSRTNPRSSQHTFVKNPARLTKPQGNPALKIHYATDTKLPSFIRSPKKNNSARIGQQPDARVATFRYLDELKDVLQITKSDEQFSIQNIRTSGDNRTSVRLEQRYKGVPVYGAEVVVHLSQSGDGESFNGKYFLIKEEIDVKPAISEISAVRRVDTDLSKSTTLRKLSALERKLVQYEQPKATLCIYQDKGLVKTNVLAYHIISCPSLHKRWEYFVDATTGAILHQFESTCAVDGPRTATGLDLNGVSRSINTYQSGANYFMVDIARPMYLATGSVLPDEPIGGIITIDMNDTFGDNQTVQHVVSSNNAWGSATQRKGLSAHFNAGVAYEYFLSQHGRESIDGQNGTIISIVNVPDEDGEDLDNAYWNGKAMFYGNGDVDFSPLAGAMDVAGHEMTHGVVQSTANLEYQGESGAINESIADIFGTMMDPADWLIGEDVVNPAVFPSGAMRSLIDPHNGGSTLSSPGFQPKHISEKYNGTQDNGGVHINSGIPNHAFYLYATAITREKAAEIYYRALDEYLTKSSQFIDLRLAVIQAATDLFGPASTEVTQAGIAFDAVGITNGQGGDYTEDLPTNPGAEFMLVYNTATTDTNTLYRVNQAENAVALTKTDFISRPSVTDKGDVAVFVAADNAIHIIKTTPGSTPTETVFQNATSWSNVVISKGGSKLAAVTTGQDAMIHVYDFVSREWAAFQLYNPTYTEGVNSAGPVYADALEWDYTGEFLVYDCFNRIDNTNGSAIEYWDVNFIRVWDNDADTFADGMIEKLFSSLPAGVSIGNPAFSKNSPNILAFDLIDATSVELPYAILGCNIETGDVDVIVENNTYGWPSYNKTDDRLAYTSLNENDEYIIAYVLLNASKITAASGEIELYQSTKWPVYFATGLRETGDDVITDIPPEESTQSAVSCYPNAFERDVTIEVADPALTRGNVEIINAIGQSVSMTMQVQDDRHLILNLEKLKPGYYFLRISNEKKTGTCKLIKK